MIRVLGGFLLHRFILTALAFAAVNFSGAVARIGDDGLPNIRPFTEVWPVLASKVSRIPELQQWNRIERIPFSRLKKYTVDPFFWCAKAAAGSLQLSGLAALLLVSNLFFLLFLLETYQLVSRMNTTAVATAVTVLMVYWPTSYELSLGSRYALTLYLCLASLRCAFDGVWWKAGVYGALLGLSDPLFLVVAPLLGWLIAYFHRGQPAARILRDGVLLFVPTLAVFVGHYLAGGALRNAWTGSALLNGFMGGGGWALLAQWVTLLIVTVGMVVTFLGGAVWAHRLLPPVLWLGWTLFSPVGALASRAFVAGVCFQGLLGRKWVARLLHASAFSWGAREVFAVFS